MSVVVVPRYVPQIFTHTDDFNRPDEANLGAPYVVVGTVAVSGNKAVTSGNSGAAINTGSQAQIVAADVAVPTTYSNIGVNVRYTNSGVLNDGYYFAMLGGAYYLIEQGSAVVGPVGALPAAGTVVRMQAEITAGHIITCKADGITVITHDDSASPLLGTYAGFRGNASAGHSHDNFGVGPL